MMEMKIPWAPETLQIIHVKSFEMCAMQVILRSGA